MGTVEFDDYIAPDGSVYHFNSSLDRFITDPEGYGMPDIDYIEQQGPFQHGKTIIDYRLKPRVIQFTHRRDACSLYDYWDNRANLLNLLRPNRSPTGSFQPGVLRKYLPSGAIRDIDVTIQAGPRFSKSKRSQKGWDEWGIEDSIQFYAGDPTFYDPELKAAGWGVSAVDHIVFPFVFGMVFGSSVLVDSLNVTYTGTWNAYPTITMVGPVGYPVITNTSTGEKIAMLYEIKAGETVTINCQFGMKTVKNNLNLDLMGTLTSDSNLATFHIGCDPEAPGGVNVMSVAATGLVQGVSDIRMNYQTRYIGI